MARPIPSEIAYTITRTFTDSVTATSTPTDLPTDAPSPEIEKLPPTIGPIPLAAFIPMCFFAPFFIGLTLWLIYRYTIKRWSNRRVLLRETRVKEPRADLNRDVEMQVERFVNAPPPVRTKVRRDRRTLSLESLSEENSSASSPERNRPSPLRQEWSQFHFNAL